MSHAGADYLAAQIDRSQALLDRLDREHDQNPRLAELQHWQRVRLRETYADLRARPRFVAACEFFLEELYGGRDMRMRDQQLERALPVMRRMLPDHLLHAVGEALRLQWISLDFDARLARALDGPLNQPEYARGYRRLDDWTGRREQIELIGELGDLLRRTVRIPMILRLVRWMRRPAHAAGFGTLQEFLENGLDAFAAMGEDAKYFVDLILERETRALERMEQGESWPFHEWIDHGPDEAEFAGQGQADD
ncbi:MAG: FFLEELY motif protein [Wenzhouxiangellaceae bacterium]